MTLSVTTFNRVNTDVIRSIIAPMMGSTKLEIITVSQHTHCRACCFTIEREQAFDKAHQLAEQCYTYVNLVLVNKKMHEDIKPLLEKLGKVIVSIIQPIQGQKGYQYGCGHGRNSGPRLIRHCVDRGLYLKVLRIYFFYHPKALYNESKERDGTEGLSILHLALDPKYLVQSLPLITFILEINKKHKLRLLELSDTRNRTPLFSLLCDYTYRFSSQDYFESSRVQFLKNIIETILKFTENKEECSKLLPKDSSLFQPIDFKILQHLFKESEIIEKKLKDYVSFPIPKEDVKPFNDSAAAQPLPVVAQSQPDPIRMPEPARIVVASQRPIEAPAPSIGRSNGRSRFSFASIFGCGKDVEKS